MLRDLTLQLPRGKLSMIVGAVGAGKASVPYYFYLLLTADC